MCMSLKKKILMSIFFFKLLVYFIFFGLGGGCYLILGINDTITFSKPNIILQILSIYSFIDNINFTRSIQQKKLCKTLKYIK